MLRLDIEKVIKATASMEMKRGLMAQNAWKKWQRKVKGTQKEDEKPRQTKHKVTLQLKKATMLKKVQNRRLSNIQFEKLEQLYIKQEKNQPLGWYEYCKLLMNDENGTGKHVQRVLIFAILLSLSLQMVSDMPEFTSYGEGSASCRLEIEQPCVALMNQVKSLSVESPTGSVRIPLGEERTLHSCFFAFTIATPPDQNTFPWAYLPPPAL
jgi:hypothetical protein